MTNASASDPLLAGGPAATASRPPAAPAQDTNRATVLDVGRIADAQRDMRLAYFSGAPGTAASAVIWLASGLVATIGSPKAAVFTLLIGGMLIHPIAVTFCKALGRSGVHTRGNPLAALALESTFILVLCMWLAFALSLFRLTLFYPAMLVIIGARYFTFATIYGMRMYWACGVSLAAAGFVLAALNARFPAGAFAGAAIESVFAALIFAGARAERRPDTV